MSDAHVQLGNASQHQHRARNIGAAVLGGLGIVLLCLGIIAMVIIGFVSSPDAAKSTVESALAHSAIRDVIADELVTKVEDSADNPQEKIVFSIARPIVLNAVASALDKPVLREAAGNIASVAYSVFVEEELSKKADIEPFVTAAVDAIKFVDPKIAKTFAPDIEPIEFTREADSPDIKGIRDLAKRSSWALLVAGILLQIAAWFLSIGDVRRKVRTLGSRLLIGGILLLVVVVVARRRVPQMTTENRDALDAVTQFVTEPIWSRALLVIAVGLMTAVVGEILLRRSQSLSPTHNE